jgi:type II secretory ATPase GspE/PulE/Tfp pilus assembly ATPase PilB-like protein
MTIEDPVEYQIDNINQIQVNSKTDLTFAKGLRSIVRQDPDVILVGEIRDNETADIAINSAMTGHLVLSTLHTNDAVTAFPRLMDMGVEPYLIASTVNVVVAQRLVRKICVKCRVSDEIVYAKKKMRCYVGKGCAVCHNSGYSGRVGIFEVLVMNELNVVTKLNSEELRKIAIKSGMRTMLEDGILKVKQGITTIDEVLRVTTE